MTGGGTGRSRAFAGAAALLVAAAACLSDGVARAGESNGSVRGQADEYEAVITRTEGGVPHITGDTYADVTFGQGWASGEDRSCDLADQVVKVRGERARWLGPGEDDENIESDLAWKVIGIFDRASSDFESARPRTVELFDAFAAGWNAHLEEVGVDGLAGWCAGAPWVRPVEPVEVYAYARAVALSASSGAVVNYIAGAQPPIDVTTTPASATTPAAALNAPAMASNAWAIGADRSADGGGLLLANPHFPWEGERRFWEAHLTVPGELDIYGSQLSGLPGIGIGFTEEFGWTHTVSAGNRFTAYRLTLVPGSPTTYMYGDEQRPMTATDVTVDVLQADGSVVPHTRTMYSSHYGPMLDFPGIGWTAESAITYRDGNIDNDEFAEQYVGMDTADDFDEFVAVHKKWQGVPLFNTIAVSKDGRAWYADTSATPNLSDEAIDAYEASLETDGVVALAANAGAVVLDGSDPMFEWVEERGARDPGLVPYRDLPKVERDDYVFNANDSFWVPHAAKLLAGDFSPLHGRQETPRSPRTRENAAVLGDDAADGPSGRDGAFTLDELADAALQNGGYTSRALLDEVVARCQGVTTVDVPELTDDDGTGLPAATVDIAPGCAVLAQWDGVYDLDRAGAVVWREMMLQLESMELREDGRLWAEPFDPENPVDTPAGLAPPPADGPDPILEFLARAVQTLQVAGLPVEVTLGDAQFALRSGTKVPIHGGNAFDGTTNIVGFGNPGSIRDPAFDEINREVVSPNSQLARIGADTGYLINNGTSFLMALGFTDDGPQARVFLNYSGTEDRSDPSYVEATQRFSVKDWRTVAWTDEQIEKQQIDRKTVRS